MFYKIYRYKNIESVFGAMMGFNVKSGKEQIFYKLEDITQYPFFIDEVYYGVLRDSFSITIKELGLLASSDPLKHMEAKFDIKVINAIKKHFSSRQILAGMVEYNKRKEVQLENEATWTRMGLERAV